ncbi:protein HID1 [Diaphorina citri]|uniref:Protein HID1 n=1 Tax=Diaphorina citri TaxID=121845 RepID=A0A3Q0IQG6_DIACI|nr:protein HID1 [Diaphorina citri]
MGNSDTKLNFRQAVIQLTSKTQPIDASDNTFWNQFWSENVTNAQDIFTLIPSAEIRALREEAPSNLATLCYKAVEKLVNAVDSSCRMAHEQQAVLNCTRLLTRLIPYIFEDMDWRGFFWSSLPSKSTSDENEGEGRKSGPDKAEDLQSIDSCEYIWERGVGFATSPARCPAHESARTELLKLLLTCFSETIYQPPQADRSAEIRALREEAPSNLATLCYKAVEKLVNAVDSSCRMAHEQQAVLNCTRLLTRLIPYIFEDMDWRGFFWSSLPSKSTSDDNEGEGSTPAEDVESVPLAQSLLNAICDLLFCPDFTVASNKSLRQLGTQDNLFINYLSRIHRDEDFQFVLLGTQDNLFINYLSRIHRDEDFQFVLAGFSRLLNNPLLQTYLPNSTKKIEFHQELLVLFWKMCDYNKKFLYYVLKSSDVLDILVPILYHLNDSRADQSRVGLMHIGVFILLLLSGERNFGVRLNKPYSAAVPMDIPVFTGTHADLLMIVFHKVITSGHNRLQPLFDCLFTILVNVSPYLKTLSMVASTKLLHLLEAFASPAFLYTGETNHHLVFFLLEIFNNIIQYQFDGNSNLVYTIIRKRQIFYALSNLPSDSASIHRALSVSGGRKRSSPLPPLLTSAPSSPSAGVEPSSPSMEGSKPALPAEPGTLNATLADTPGIEKMTEKESAHPGGENENVVAKPSSISSPIQHSHPRVWTPTPEWVKSWKDKLPLQTIMRLLQVLVPQVEKICIDKGLTDESEILKFLQHGTLVGLLPVPHPILIRKYQANSGTTTWFRTYMWGVIYLRNVDPPIWYDTDVKLFEIQRV